MTARIEVQFKPDVLDAAGLLVAKRIQSDINISVDNVRVVDVYTIDKQIDSAQAEQCRVELFTDPFTQDSVVDGYMDVPFDWAVEIGFLPGVTDNVGTTSREGVTDLLGVTFAEGEKVYSGKRYLLSGELSGDQVQAIAALVSNELINSVTIRSREEFMAAGGMNVAIPRVTMPISDRVDDVDLQVSDDEMMKISNEGILEAVENGVEIRRGPLALDMASMRVIQEYFKGENRKPTDVELEVLAQTWSEHCKHTIFAAKIDDVDSVYKTYIKGATQAIRKKLGDDDWCLSVFVDNSGVIKLTDDYSICYKVETHNSPSALDPYGGAITGIVGVNRDPLGTGMGARLLVNMYGFCFGNPYWDKPLFYRGKGKNNPILHPKVIFEGVRVGVEHGGNKSGIPTPWGFIQFDDRYMGKPLVFVGTMGLMPTDTPMGPGHLKNPAPGDLIVMAGGRVGKDGIHGATFSSESLHAGSPAGAVQIGDPITQKRLADAQQEAQAQGLYSAVTDNGAGGLSSSVGEMAETPGGCEVNLEKVPIKYAGLRPYEIWISESQERMTYSIPPEKIDAFLDLMKRRGVEATVIGTFTDSGRCLIKFNEKPVLDLDMDFMHNGLPKKVLTSKVIEQTLTEPVFAEASDYSDDIVTMAGRLNTCSREYVSRQYDHEVQGGSVIKPLVGVDSDVHTVASVNRPLYDSDLGVALSSGILPWYSDIDTYHMAACSIDTAIRNVIAVGADPDRIALLDNFCWSSSNEPERLWQLQRAGQACYDYAIAYGTPFISGKDSMFNDFKGFDEDDNPVKISVPPTLLISSIGLVQDVNTCVTLDAKQEGDLVYMLGMTRDELGGSEYYRMKGEQSEGTPLTGAHVPTVNTEETVPLYRAVHKAITGGLVASVNSVRIGGLAQAVTETAMGGNSGINIRLADVPFEGSCKDHTLLFSESQGRFLVTVAPQHKDAFEAALDGCTLACIGEVTAGASIAFTGINGSPAGSADVAALKSSYKTTLGW